MVNCVDEARHFKIHSPVAQVAMANGRSRFSSFSHFKEFQPNKIYGFSFAFVRPSTRNVTKSFHFRSWVDSQSRFSQLILLVDFPSQCACLRERFGRVEVKSVVKFRVDPGRLECGPFSPKAFCRRRSGTPRYSLRYTSRYSRPANSRHLDAVSDSIGLFNKFCRHLKNL